MTKLLQRMHDELVRRNYAATTIRTYLHALNLCHRQHPGRRADHCAEADRKDNPPSTGGEQFSSGEP